MDMDSLKFDENGLIPCVVQDCESGQVLTLAYMNRESVGITLAEGRTCFYSRSRRELWRKGEQSGNVQRLVSLTADCDGDALLARVKKSGPACHTGAESCFFTPLGGEEPGEAFTSESLYSLLLDRKAKMPEGSYTSYLFGKGREKILKKVGEECTEVIIAAMKQDARETVFEIADLAYHVLVLMAEAGISPARIRSELAGRHVIDKKVKQETLQ